MRTHTSRLSLVLSPLIAVAGCNKETAKSDPTSSRGATSTSQSADGGNQSAQGDGSPTEHGSTAHADPHAGLEGAHAAASSGNTLTHGGLTLTVPEGWKAGDIGEGPFPPIAVYDLPSAGGDLEGVQVRITHFPGMKGKDDMNLMRWLGQVSKEDGASYSMDEANLVVSEMGNVRLKTIDLSGNVKATMRANPQPMSRMIAAIVDHPNGPHFVVATGTNASVAKWAASIQSFIKSATFK